MKKALQKKSTDVSPKMTRTGRRISDGMLHPIQHERLEISPADLHKCDTVDLGDVPGSRKNRSRSPSPNIQTIPEDGEIPPKRVPRFKKQPNFSIPRSRSPSPVPPEYAEQAAIINAQLQENNNSPKPSPRSLRRRPTPRILDVAPSVSVTSPDGDPDSDTSDKENEVEEKTKEDVEELDEEAKWIQKIKRSAEKLRHIIDELVDTEIGYGKDLRILMSTYLMPVKVTGVFPDDEIEALISNVKEITEFQEVFQKSIVEAKALVPEYQTLEDPNDFRRIVFSMGSAFLFHRDTFNLYSTFCAVHSKVQKLLQSPSSKEGKKLLEFLQSRPSADGNGSSGTVLGMSSYLIKPMQRILKYPLLIGEMQGRFDAESETFYHLGGSLSEMQRVANHINDMMKVHEQFGNIFESLLAETQQQQQSQVLQSQQSNEETNDTEPAPAPERERLKINMDDLVMYNTAFWSNAADILGKDRRARSAQPEITVLVFHTAVILISKEARRGRRRSLVDFVASSQAAEGGDGTCYKKLIPITNVQVKDSEDGDSEDCYPWELIHKDDSSGQEEKTVFKFYCSTVDLKAEFIKTIKHAVNTHNRKRILKGAGKAAHVLRKISEYKYGGKRLEDLKSAKQGTPNRTLRRFASSAEESRKPKISEGGKRAGPKRTETV